MKNRFVYSLILAALAAAFGAGYSLRKVQTVYVDVPRTVIDTTYVQVERIVYQHLPAVHDTVRQDLVVTVRDTVFAPYEVARTDAILERDGVKYGRLEVAYYFPPADWFDVQFDPAPLPTVTVTKFIEVAPRWYTRPLVTLGAGVLAGTVIAKYSK